MSETKPVSPPPALPRGGMNRRTLFRVTAGFGAAATAISTRPQSGSTPHVAQAQEVDGTRARSWDEAENINTDIKLQGKGRVTLRTEFPFLGTRLRLGKRCRYVARGAVCRELRWRTVGRGRRYGCPRRWWPCPSGKFANGDTARVTEALNMRSGASNGNGVIVVLPADTTGRVSATPTSANGYTWWRIETSQSCTAQPVQDWLGKEQKRLQEGHHMVPLLRVRVLVLHNKRDIWRLGP